MTHTDTNQSNTESSADDREANRQIRSMISMFELGISLNMQDAKDPAAMAGNVMVALETTAARFIFKISKSVKDGINQREFANETAASVGENIVTLVNRYLDAQVAGPSLGDLFVAVLAEAGIDVEVSSDAPGA